jgi:hypothetical protein
MPFTLDTYALTTVERAKQQIGIPTAVTDEDDLLTRMINTATDQIEEFTDRKILSRSYTEYQDGRKNNRILTKQWPVTTVTELWDDPASEFTNTSNQFDASDFAIDGDETGIVLLRTAGTGRQFLQGTRNIKIVYTAGYTETPYSLEEAALWLIHFYFDKKQDKSVQIDSKNKNTETTKFLKKMPPFVADLLMPYKRSEWPQANAPVING